MSDIYKIVWESVRHAALQLQTIAERAEEKGDDETAENLAEVIEYLRALLEEMGSE